MSSAIQRGIRFEICYSPGISGGSDARRNVISGATALIRATRGQGIILSSEARNALGLRGPHDVINLISLWGLGQERGKEALCEEADKVVRLARLRRETFRGVVGVVDDGRVVSEDSKAAEQMGGKGKEKFAERPSGKPHKTVDLKRKASSTSLNSTSIPATATATSTPASTESEKPLSKREQKRRAKKTRFEANNPRTTNGKNDSETLNYDAEDGKDVGGDSSFPIKHEALSAKHATNSRTTATKVSADSMSKSASATVGVNNSTKK